jgi:hypothetical protein
MNMKLALVVQRYGLDIAGGAEYHCRLVAEHLARHASVSVLTTCASDYVTWANDYPEGEEVLNGVPVRRFAVERPRDVERFSALTAPGSTSRGRSVRGSASTCGAGAGTSTSSSSSPTGTGRPGTASTPWPTARCWFPPPRTTASTACPSSPRSSAGRARLSMATLEAWWAERPVLVNAKCAVLRGQCKRANGGLYYATYDEFREALALLEGDESLRRTLGENGRRYFEASYAWPVVEGKYLDLLGRLRREDQAA